jgi:hypothetical protein
VGVTGKYGYLLHGKTLGRAFQTDREGTEPLSDYLTRIAPLRNHPTNPIGIYATAIPHVGSATFSGMVCIGSVSYRRLQGKFGACYLGDVLDAWYDWMTVPG